MSKWMLSGTLLLFVLSSILGGPGVLASPLKDLQKEHKLIEKKKTELNSSIKEKKVELQSVQSTIDNIMSQIQTLNNKITETNDTIDRVEADIEQTTREIDALLLSVADLEKKIEERDEVLRERARAMQVQGGQVNYLDVLLGASSFSDFIDRFSAVSTLMEADRNIMIQQAEDKNQLEEEKVLVEQKLSEQEERMSSLESMKASLVSQKSEMNKLIDTLEDEQDKLEKEKSHLEHAYEEAYEVSKELEQKVAAEQKRLAEIARKAEAERKRREAAAREAAKKNPGATIPVISSGTWTTPTVGRFTSGFGGRNIGAGAEQHRGVDFANKIGTPIVAAGDGIVSYAGGLGTYGNVVMITHSINGQIYTTVYAHLSKIGVSSGQSVDKGQYIGAMGNTGRSTGPHLHFEFHIGNWSSKGPGAVNPLRYVPF